VLLCDDIVAVLAVFSVHTDAVQGYSAEFARVVWYKYGDEGSAVGGKIAIGLIECEFERVEESIQSCIVRCFGSNLVSHIGAGMLVYLSWAIVER
jgi:hypothetical protein